MSGRNFMELLRAQWERGHFVCVGLDSDIEKIPQCMQRQTGLDTILGFNKPIVNATKDLAGTYKLNIAFYEAEWTEGMEALLATIEHIFRVAPDVPIILDAKRGDIGRTNAKYVQAAFNYLQADAITVNPYFGGEALQPFLECKDKGIFVLCRTSNPGADEFQDLPVPNPVAGAMRFAGVKNPGLPDSDPPPAPDTIPLYQRVAYQVAHSWNKNGNCGLVVGATCPEPLRKVREIAGDEMPILNPGAGTQGGDVEKAVTAGKNSRGQGFIINSSSGIVFASKGTDFAEAARRETEELAQKIYLALRKGSIPAGQASPL